MLALYSTHTKLQKQFGQVYYLKLQGLELSDYCSRESFMINKRFQRWVLKPALKPVFWTWKHNNLKHYDMKNTIVVASSGRGGSTWLAEIIGSLPGYPLIYEPLNRRRYREEKYIKYGLNDIYIPDSRKQIYLQQLFTGANFAPNLVSLNHFRLDQFLGFQGFVVKFIKANLLLYWMLRQFPVRAIFMVRHPCAVISSQLSNRYWRAARSRDWASWFDELSHKPSWQELMANYPHLAELSRRVKTTEEGFAFTWAMNNYVPLSQPKPHPWYLTTYERLALEGEREVDRLFQFLGKATPVGAYERLGVPSFSTQADSNIALGRNKLTGWKKKLTPQQIDTILNIVHQVGINFYSDDIEPDYEKLLKFGE